ncbi:DUF362 domain-containing protein [Thermodesulfobacteriota bacterium]
MIRSIPWIIPKKKGGTMGNLEGIGLEFSESMSGWVSIGEIDPTKGELRGRKEGTEIRFEVKVIIRDLTRFLNVSDHTTDLQGTVTLGRLGVSLPIIDGKLSVFTVERDTGVRQMKYSFRFTGSDGKTYFLLGHKRIKDDPVLNLVQDMTTLVVYVYSGTDEGSPVYATGKMFFRLTDVTSLLGSIKVTGEANWAQRLAAKTAFISFAFGILRDQLLSGVNPLYDTECENLVLSGTAAIDESGSSEFFLVSGAHDKGFPWGDDENFWDVLLVVGSGDTGYTRFCISHRHLEGLKINIESGEYQYKGPIFKLIEGNSTAFSLMRSGDPALSEYQADIRISFKARPYETTPFPFQISSRLLEKLSHRATRELRSLLPSERLLGIHVTPHFVRVWEGRIRIHNERTETVMRIVPEQTLGEAEITTIRNVREPTTLYGYICAVNPKESFVRLQIHANSLRNDRPHWIKDRIDSLLGAVVSRLCSKDLLIRGGQCIVTDLAAKEAVLDGPRLFVKRGDPILEVNNDHFPTAVLQRRIVEVTDPSGVRCLALEEDMNLMRLEALNSGRKVDVAAICHENKRDALDTVLRETGFWELLEEKLRESGKTRSEFTIAIKPNFMFTYNKEDATTYTDPELVEHLVQELRKPARGFDTIRVVEAQSTYGEYFHGRRVRDVADYVGYAIDGSRGYEVVDLTEDDYETHRLGKNLGAHPIPKSWGEADFRISFAKNKTHCYAYYTLTLKNIFGALPLGNKFKEYHCDRDIYHTTIEYLQAFPVDYGLIDAVLSADGPFGIFACPAPKRTMTVIGGADLVAVDWVGASKMGLDPMISDYMRPAVESFGKPEIRLIGNPNPYRPWLNVPATLTMFANRGLDANHYFGNLLYMASAYMDDARFEYKSKSEFLKAARAAIKPLQEAIFLLPEGERSVFNRILSRLFDQLGE